VVLWGWAALQNPKKKARPMIVNFDAEVVWTSFGRCTLLPGLTGSSEEKIEAFYEKYEEMKKAPDLSPRYPMA
jgi:hypothetical protein